jgi:hypothetical protein
MRNAADPASEQARSDAYIPHEHEELRELAGLLAGRAEAIPDAEVEDTA